MSDLSPLFTWRSAVVDSGLPATARHVALTLSLHMNERGGSCFPAVDTLARETGLSARAVQKQLALLDAEGYLAVSRGGGRGNSNRYTATVPPITEPDSPNDVHPLAGKGERDDEKGCTTFTRGRQEGDSSSSGPDIVHAASRLAAKKKLRDRKGPPVTDRHAWLNAAAARWRDDNADALARHAPTAVTAQALYRAVEDDDRPAAVRHVAVEVSEDWQPNHAAKDAAVAAARARMGRSA